MASKEHPTETDDENRKEIFVDLFVELTLNQDTRFLVDVWSPMVELAGFDRKELIERASRRLEQHE